MHSSITRINKKEHILERKLVILLLIALVLASDLIGLKEEHCRQCQGSEEEFNSGDDTTIINKASKCNPPEQYYRCDKKGGAKRQTCELYSTSNSHYGPIVSIQQIPSGAAGRRVAPTGSFRQGFIALVDELAHASGDSSRTGIGRPFDWCDNDNQTTSNESQESRKRGNGQLWSNTRTIITLNHSRNSMPTPETEGVCFNGIKSLSACSYESRQVIRCETRPQKIPPQPTVVRRRKWLAWPTIRQAEAIRLVRLDVPHSIPAGQALKLRCLYETKGDKLQSLAWYRNGREFYRYQPFERRQPVLAFNSTGVHVDITRSRNHTVYLTNTTLETSGRFRCEATGTTFQEAKLETFIEVKPSASSSGTDSVCHLTRMTILVVAITQLASNLLTRNICNRIE